ncbi:hypothetical protein LY11_01277 [Pedobacter cryoconitis]|uniref:Lipoprotein n=2 Tax=Pedobacter cryoconitis TaxID=188932 RepID=A0A327T1N4_9SPHI|nr:hypothetical protein LY11_01277 [Pedobacter cryoconitis]
MLFKTGIMKVTKSLFVFAMFVILFVIQGCDSREKKVVRTSYLAIKGADTAILKLTVTGTQFIGQYEINYHGSFKDSGDVKGAIKGDTLIGDYHFQHYGLEKWLRGPIALLKKDGRLILGTGTLESYLGISYFKRGEPIDYSAPKFIFQKTY